MINIVLPDRYPYFNEACLSDSTLPDFRLQEWEQIYLLPILIIRYGDLQCSDLEKRFSRPA